MGTTEKLIIYVLSQGEWLSTKNIVELLNKIKISESAVRATLFRLRNRGIIKGSRQGKETLFALADKGKEFIANYFHRISRIEKKWNGKWLLFSFNIPEKKRRLRNVLREELVSIGCGRLHANLWISPYDLRDECKNIVERLNVKEHTVMFITDYIDDNPKKLTFRVWNLERLSKEYQKLQKKYKKQYGEFKRSNFKEPSRWALEALVRLLKLKEEIAELSAGDPFLPRELLPDNWIGFALAQDLIEYSQFLQEKSSAVFNFKLSPPAIIKNIFEKDVHR